MLRSTGSSLPIFLAISARDSRRGTQHEATGVRSLWEEIAWGRFEALAPESESSIDRGSALRGSGRGSINDEWGRSESVDPDNVGDIADEGAGHRG